MSAAPSSSAPLPRNVGFAFQPDMLLHRGRDVKHPECPERLTTTLERLRAAGLLDRCHALQERLASDAELLTVHTEGHLQRVAAATAAVRETPDDRGLREPQGDGAIYYHEATEQAARCAAGSVIEAAEAALRGDVSTAFALVRPPGHHAEADEPLGFCFYNNVAVAAATATRLAQRVQRVAVLDWDVHHGNGTQHIFDTDPNVLVISIHRYGRGFFPGTGAAEEVGEGAARGKTVNVPWIQAGLGDADYAAAFALVVMPVLREFRPQLLLVSAGFDAALGDVQGKMRCSPAGFASLTRSVLTLPACTPVVVFEGGYHLDASAACTQAVLEELLTAFASPAAAAGAPSDANGTDGGTPGDGATHDDSKGVGKGSGEGGAPDDATEELDAAAVAAADFAAATAADPAALGSHTEATLRRVIGIQREHWACLRSDAHTMVVESYFTTQGRGARKRGR